MFSTQNQAGNLGGGSMFGNSGTTNQQSGVFGGGATNQQAGVFGGATNNQQGQQQTSSGLFGQPQTQVPQQTGGLFGSLGNNQQNKQQFGGMFGGGIGSNQQLQQQTGGPFNLGGSQNQQQTGFGLGQNSQQSGFGLGQNNQQSQFQAGGAFGLGGQNSQQPGNGLFNNSAAAQPTILQNSLQQSASAHSQPGQLNSSLWQAGSGVNPREKTIPEQMQGIMEQWDTGHPSCAFKHYFYNKIPEKDAPFFRPSPHENPKKWEEALAKKPGPGFVPVLCTGFAQMGERIATQQKNLSFFNNQLHQINDSLTKMLQDHDTKTSIRAMDAKRKHVVLKQRCLALAAKVQILQNRGYAMGGDEEDLRTKLMALDKGVSDPGLGARAEDIWARMITVQERAKLLRAEIEKTGSQSTSNLDENTEKAAKKILEDYQTQLLHLKKELDDIQQEYIKWEKEQPQFAGLNVNGR